MKQSILFTFLVISAAISGQNIYYVQEVSDNPNASDMNKGTDIEYPWATWQKAFHTAQAGDTVYFRGGVWAPKTKASQGYPVTRIDPDAGYGYNGTYENPICYLAYPPDYENGNLPVLDCQYASEEESGNTGLSIQGASYLKFKGLTVKNVRMLHTEHNVIGIGGSDLGTVYLENMVSYNIGGAGIWMRGYDTVYIVNCDVYNCCDSLDTSWPGGDGDGIVASSRKEADDTTYLTVVRGCRVWNVSDDGFDIGSTKQVQVDSCWSFNNGNYGDYSGDGTGFKYAYSRVLTDGKRWTQNCISAYNSATGFAEVNLYDETYGPRMNYYNNVSYRDGGGFGSGPNYFDCGIDPAHDIYRNNIVYSQYSDFQCIFAACDYEIPKYITQDHNTWLNGNYHRSIDNPDYLLKDDDFVSLDTAQIRKPRKQDGSLPDITFLRPAEESVLINTGIDVGLPYFGSAPDLGAYEDGSLSIVIKVTSKNKEVTEGEDLILQAFVSDNLYSISEVNFFIEDTERNIGQGEKVAPSIWQLNWRSDTVNFQNIRAVAYNSNKDKATSNRVNVLIIPYVAEFEGEYSLFPNPNNGCFSLVFKEGLEESHNINIVGLDGRIHNSEYTISKGAKYKDFSDLAFLSAGVYFITFSNNESNKKSIMPIKFVKL